MNYLIGLIIFLIGFNGVLAFIICRLGKTNKRIQAVVDDTRANLKKNRASYKSEPRPKDQWNEAAEELFRKGK